MSEQNLDKPYRALGLRLRSLRETVHESVAEVSGAVEIDSDTLAQIERGERRPSEEILMLLMNHFNMQDDESIKLWELAGYTKSRLHTDEPNEVKPQVVMVVQADNRVVYTDTVEVNVNNYGVVMNFLQTTAPNTAPTLVSRIGMSKEHAHSVLKVLHETLSRAEQSQKSLPAPKKTTTDEPQ